ncbi:hypothetical protein I7I48_02705 [Histoplasma ohiense]|nr:hypothetical protein I7I48_02705 [Histoplasma ohiense (nom. inval.)]
MLFPLQCSASRLKSAAQHHRVKTAACSMKVIKRAVEECPWRHTEMSIQSFSAIWNYCSTRTNFLKHCSSSKTNPSFSRQWRRDTFQASSSRPSRKAGEASRWSVSIRRLLGSVQQAFLPLTSDLNLSKSLKKTLILSSLQLP